MRWRPSRRVRVRTIPAATSACRCFVTAWRVTGAPAVRSTMVDGPSEESRATSPRRVSSPSAAKTGAAPASAAPVALCRRDMTLDVQHLLGPAAFVHPERLVASCLRQPVEPGLDDGEACTAGHPL